METLLKFLSELGKLIFGEPSAAEWVAYIFFGMLGVFWIKFASFVIKRKKARSNNPPVFIKFSRKIWWQYNSDDFLLTLLVIFGVFRFFPDALMLITKQFPNVPELADKAAYGLLIGLTFQWVFHKWISPSVTATNN